MDEAEKANDPDKAKKSPGLDEPDPDWEPFRTRLTVRSVRPRRPDVLEIMRLEEAGAEPASDADKRAEPGEHGGGE